MKRHTLRRILAGLWLGLTLLVTTGCIGPNPFYSIGQSAMNATVMTFVNTFWSNVLNGN